MKEDKNKPNKKKKSKKKIIIAIAVVIILVLVGVYRFGGNGDSNLSAVTYLYDEAQERTVGIDLSSTGTLESKDAYSVMSMVSGNIVEVNFEEGQDVDKDFVLYRIDSSDADNNLEKLNNNLENAISNYDNAVEKLDDLKVKAKDFGQIVSLDVEVGDEITMGTPVANIRDSQNMVITLPFPSDEVDKFYIGENAEVVIDGTYEILQGEITEIKNVEEVLTGRRLVKYITLRVKNPSAIAKGDQATATVNEVACSESGNFDYNANYQLLAKQSGTVEKINYAEGDFVNEDDVVIILSSDAITDSIDAAQDGIDDLKLSIDSQEDVLENYVIKSPISGTVIEKNFKEDDTASMSQPLCTIFDMSYLKTIMSIDENDVSKVKVGQIVNITATALPDEKFEGIVTKVNIKGNTNNSVTTYPVSVRIDEAGDLLPGMNITASIELEKAENVVSVPVGAVLRGDYILVKDADPTHNEADYESPLVGYVLKKVETGLSDETYVEIKSGLSLGDEIAYEANSTKSIEDVMEERGPEMRNGGF